MNIYRVPKICYTHATYFLHDRAAAEKGEVPAPPSQVTSTWSTYPKMVWGERAVT